jgi:hypothetical protein
MDLCKASPQRDFEGIVAKWAHGRYQTDGRSTCWLKIKNRAYSQMDGRRGLFEARGEPGADRRLVANAELRPI